MLTLFAVGKYCSNNINKEKMEVKLNVKDKSVKTFLEERLIGIEYHNTGAHGHKLDYSPYNLMRDEMYFKKDCGIDIGETVKIELFDRATNSGRELKNIYTYKAVQYDDISIKMVLENFVVELT